MLHLWRRYARADRLSAGGGSAKEWPKTLDGAVTTGFRHRSARPWRVTNQGGDAQYSARARSVCAIGVHEMLAQKKSKDTLRQGMLQNEFHWSQLHMDHWTGWTGRWRNCSKRGRAGQLVFFVLEVPVESIPRKKQCRALRRLPRQSPHRQITR